MFHYFDGRVVVSEMQCKVAMVCSIVAAWQLYWFCHIESLILSPRVEETRAGSSNPMVTTRLQSCHRSACQLADGFQGKFCNCLGVSST